MIYRLRCTDCGDSFRHDGDEFPNFCPICGADQRVPDPDFVPSQVNIGTIKGKIVDKTFRDYSDATIAHAEQMGDPSLKVTDMKDNLREGDVAAKVPQPSQQYQQITADMQGAGFGHAPGGIGVADALALAKAGQRSGTGAAALKAIQGGRGTPIQAASTTAKGNWGGGFGG